MRSSCNDAAIARVRKCFENAEKVTPLEEDLAHIAQSANAPRVSQVSQVSQLIPASFKSLTLADELFEERAAIMEYDGGVPRALAEYLAGRSSNLDQ